MGLEAAGHFRQYTAKRRAAMFTKTCPALKKKKSLETSNKMSAQANYILYTLRLTF